ncbi:hypothetical protein IJI72_01585 [Candidatus Saccharibacteria bacterium]|nr:hypothetical protein [Candidatus Saccharibacteria bacterium]
MQLIKILLLTVSVLAILSGVAVFGGSKKEDRPQMAMFVLLVLGVSAWVVSIMTFLALPASASLSTARLAVFGIYISGLAMNIFAFAYIGWGYKIGRLMMILSTAATLLMSYLLIHDPSLLYSGIVLSSEGNSVTLVSDWYYNLYSLILTVENVSLVLILLYRIRHTSSPAVKKGWLIFMVGLMIGGLGAGVFDVMLPPTRYDLIWVGPLLMCADMIAHYYAALRYRMIIIHSSWLKVSSYIVLAALSAIIYFVLFFVIFSALFKISNPTNEVILLNFVLVIIAILLTPAISEVSSFFQSLASVRQINLGYIIKKLDRLNSTNPNLADVSAFLADHLHYHYIGIISKHKIYESTPSNINAEDVEKITSVENDSKTPWFSPNVRLKRTMEKLNLSNVAELRNSKGERVGLILFGRAVERSNLREGDRSRLLTVLSATSLVVESKQK